MGLAEWAVSPYVVRDFFPHQQLLQNIVSSLRINIDLDRINEIQNLSPPKSKKDIRSFMEKINFVRRFVVDFAKIMKPIHKMLKSNETFQSNSTT